MTEQVSSVNVLKAVKGHGFARLKCINRDALLSRGVALQLCVFHIVHKIMCVCSPLQRKWKCSLLGSVAVNVAIWLHNFVHQQVQETWGVSAKRWVTDHDDAAFGSALCAAQGAPLLRPVSAFLLHLWETA